MLKCNVELVTRKSKKTGNDYTVLEITFENGYKKMVFLERPEIYMINQLSR